MLNLENLELNTSTARGCIEVARTACNAMEDPQSVDTVTPVFSWVLQSEQRGQLQHAYQLLVADSEAALDRDDGNLWDSGRVISTNSRGVHYAGDKLVSSADYYWKVRVWGADDLPSAWSSVAHFATALLDPDEWRASWIGRGPVREQAWPKDGWEELRTDACSTLLRKQFNLRGDIASAKVHICGLGLFELHLNGRRIGGDRELVPLKTDYSRRVLYCSYDVTKDLAGDAANAIGVMLGNGWFNPPVKHRGWKMQAYGSPRAIVQLQVRYADGSTELIISDQSWQTTTGPILENSIYDGECYDATLEIPRWSSSDCTEGEWEPVNLVEAPAGELHAQQAPPIAVVDTILPVAMREVNPGVFVVDMGQNFAGWTRIAVAGPAGTCITLRHSENVHADGSLDRKTMRGAACTDRYILKGSGREVYEPHFTNHGFRYVEISGYPGELRLEDIQGRVVHSDCERVSHFESDHTLVNHLYRCASWTQRSIMQGLPVDCPQRDERLGWGADAHVMAESGIFSFDSRQFYAKWLDDVRLQQVESGDLPHVSPRPGVNGYPAWSSAYHIIVWTCYQYYGDTALLDRHYDGMRRYVDYLTSTSFGHILPRDSTGDWKSIADGFLRGGPQLLSTAFYHYAVRILAEAALVLGKHEDAKAYRNLMREIATAFNGVFQHNQRGEYKYGENTQTENAAPLFLGIAPEATRGQVLEHLVADIARHDGHLTTGFIGSKWVMEVLAESGRADLAYALLTQTSYPSWASMTAGQTTLTESWDPQKGSNNHAGLGAPIISWIFKWLAGIQVDPHRPGFEHIIIKPYIPADMGFATASLHTVRGRVVSSWEKRDGRLHVAVTVPANATATVHLPTSDPATVLEGTCRAADADAVRFLRIDGTRTLYAIESGHYHFSLPLGDEVNVMHASNMNAGA